MVFMLDDAVACCCRQAADTWRDYDDGCTFRAHSIWLQRARFGMGMEPAQIICFRHESYPFSNPHQEGILIRNARTLVVLCGKKPGA